MGRTRSLGMVLAVAGAAVVAGCGAGPTAPAAEPGDAETDAPVRTAVAGDSAEVALGETVVFESVGVEVTYVALEGDSRCPIGVDCFWEGDAEVRVRIEGAGTVEETVLHTSLDPRSVRIGAVEVLLLDVLPRPVYGEVTDPAITRIVVRAGVPRS